MGNEPRYTVTLKVFNDNNPAKNLPLQKLASFDRYEKAYAYMLKHLQGEANERERIHGIVGVDTKEFGAHLFDNGIHLSYMISDKDKRYDKK